MSIQSNFPSIKPSLLLDFANTKQLDSRITFTRASTGTFYDGVTVAKAEENLLLYSQEFDNAAWTNTATTDTANTTTAPDGTSTADTLTPIASTAVHEIQQTLSVTTGLPYTVSCFVKPNGNNFVQLAFGATGFGTTQFANFNVSTGAGAVGTVGAAATASIVDAGNGWYRCIMTATSTATTTSGSLSIVIISSSTSARRESWATTGTEQLFLWGAQLEQRSTVTFYTATTTQAITNYIPVLLTAAAGVARFEHNPTTGESLGLEIEEQRTNLVTYSEQFDNAAWSVSNTTTTANVAISPAGTQTVDLVTEDAVTAAQFTKSRAPITISSGASYTLSMYVKRGVGSLRGFRLEVGGATSGFRANFNPDTGATTSSTGYGTGAVTASGFVDVGNGWRRYFVTGTAGAETSADAMFRFTSTPTGSTIGYTGDGIQSFLLWGAQLEAGTSATSYIPTVASQVTRSADAASMTGTNFSSWYRTDEGTVYADFVSAGYTANQMIFSLTDGTLNNPVQAYFDTSTQIQLNAWGNGIVYKAAAQNTAYKYAVGLSLNNLGVSINSDAITTDTSVGPARPFSQLNIGNRNGSLIFNGTIKKIAYYPLRVTNAQLQALTTP